MPKALLAIVAFLPSIVIAGDLADAAKKEDERRASVKHDDVRTIGQDDVRTATDEPRGRLRARATTSPASSAPSIQTRSDNGPRPPTTASEKEEFERKAEARKKAREALDADIRAAEAEVETARNAGDLDMFDYVDGKKYYGNRQRLKLAEERLLRARAAKTRFEVTPVD